ncbi:MAG TPA: cobalamin biosynthesis protein CbiM [Clostridiaceae bacterium]|nr:cobalamin biosynthesis protein CbiM [Clostridiaceae bacterium]
MHMADALISPAVGGTMLAATAGVAAYSVRKIQNDIDEKKIPLMGVMGAFVFAAQMINFSIAGTGSSGHLAGGMLLAVILGPYAGFLTMASVLLIQALFFADGGLLAFGCNVFNLGFYTCFIVYPLIYKRLTRKGINSGRIFAASILSSIIGLQLGAFSVVLETLLSGKTELPFSAFLMLMLPIHLAIGIVEGLITSAVVVFVWKARPEIIESSYKGKEIVEGFFPGKEIIGSSSAEKEIIERFSPEEENTDTSSPGKSYGNVPMKKVLVSFIIAAVIIGGVLSWFASSNPDGLEWSILKVTGGTEPEITNSEPETSNTVHKVLSEIQEKIAFFPDYEFKADDSVTEKSGGLSDEEETWPAVSAETSVSGLVGGALTLALCVFIGLIIGLVKKKKMRKAV